MTGNAVLYLRRRHSMGPAAWPRQVAAGHLSVVGRGLAFSLSPSISTCVSSL